nr:immunoglobulin light chain junction region [Macaca mulatta]
NYYCATWHSSASGLF